MKIKELNKYYPLVYQLALKNQRDQYNKSNHNLELWQDASSGNFIWEKTEEGNDFWECFDGDYIDYPNIDYPQHAKNIRPDLFKPINMKIKDLKDKYPKVFGLAVANQMLCEYSDGYNEYDIEKTVSSFIWVDTTEGYWFWHYINECNFEQSQKILPLLFEDD